MIKVQRFTFNFFAENTYLAYDETREAVLIDCGCMNGREETVLSNFITMHQLDLKRLICTHYHTDHVIGNPFIYRTYGLKPEIHAGERAPGMPSLKQQAAMLGMMTNLEEVDTEHFIEEGEEIRFGNSALKAFLVPGHSPASLAYYCQDGKFVFTGDALFQGTIGRTDLWGGDFETLISSIQNKLFTLPDDTVIYPGHESSSTIGIEKQTNPYFISNKNL
ncbi:MAG: MBL fold metallo-hydrolase [Tannerella sp.]|jgi:glyoxylase-like metal-dependent hydrolase (beta-lactamase superfamily II)|nr:MBL fold metallo-hydrolase [Tannerella sp.]